MAEPQRIQRQFDLAAKLYAGAVTMAHDRVGGHRASCTQARRLMNHLGATSEERRRVHGVFQREVEVEAAAAAVGAIRALGRSRVLTFVGFSGAGYEDERAVRELILQELQAFTPADTLICAGATPDGIGMVYPIALEHGFRTAGIVSSQARSTQTRFSNECEIVVVVRDDTWGGRRADGRLSPTSRAMVDASDVMVAIGGGVIARDELDEARKIGKSVRFHDAEMNHALAIEKAAGQGREQPKDFRGEARLLFSDF